MSEEEEFAKLPLPDQFAHKNWKARKGGYEIAARDFKTAQPTDPLVREFIFESNLWKAAVSDSNVAAQQEALNAYNAFLEAAGTEGARKTRSSTVTGVVEKGLLGRPAAKAAALETLLLLIELDKADPIIEELLPFLAHKQPKVIAATLSALTSLYHAYGCKTIEPKPVIKLLPKVFGHADKNVRAEGQALTVELYRWLREAMKPLFWGELKELQQKDLEKLFAPVQAEPAPKQERLLRSQQAAQEVAAAAGEDVDAEVEDEEAEVIDLEPEYEAVDVLAKVPKDFGDRLASTKWKDRKEALDDLFTAVNVPAMQEGSFDEVLRGCAKSMKDANIAVVAVAANCIECIAKGLRKSFTRYRGTVLGAMLERFKEKKASVTDALAAACDAVFAATGLAEIQGDVLEALQAKNPQVKEHTAKFLVRSLKLTREAPSLEQTKEFAEAGKKLLTESVATLRDAGAEILGTLWKIMGDRNVLAHLDGIDEIKKTKIKEFSDAAEVRAKWKPKAAAPPPKAAAAPAAASKRPASKRPVGTTKKAAPAPRAVTPPPAEEAAPLQPRPTSRPAGKAPAGLRPPGGLKAPGSGLQKPQGLKAPGSVREAAASPRRQLAAADDAPPPTPRASTLAGRGLAGRPLGKPQPTSPPPREQSYSHQHETSSLSATERDELASLRTELDLLRSQTSDLRQDKMRLHTKLAGVEAENDRLIEEVGRGEVVVRAKEAVIVRLREEVEDLGRRAEGWRDEGERLRREMGRLGNVRSGDEGEERRERIAYGGGRANGGTPATARGYQGSSAANGHGGGASEYSGGGGEMGDDEGKENRPVDLPPSSSNTYSKLSKPAYSAASSATQQQQQQQPPQQQQQYNPPTSNRDYHQQSYTSSTAQQHAPSSRPLSNGYGGGGGSGRATPTMMAAPSSSSHEGGSDGNQSSQVNGGGRSEQGVESWRRAAEVTQNLKARIEMMKARQNLGTSGRGGGQ